jgi:hypothetical protein
MRPRNLIFLLVFLFAGYGNAQSTQFLKFQQGEEVEVHYLGKWREGRVLGTDRRRGVYCQYKFVSTSERWFAVNDVRRSYEHGAISRARLWKDAEGKFSVVAALMAADETTATLQTDEMKTIKVPIEKLSTGDRAFLKRIAKESLGLTGVGAHRSKVEEFDMSTAIDVAASESNGAMITADPMRSSLHVAEGGSAFEVGNIYDQIGAIIPLGGPDHWLLASLENKKTSEHEKLPTRLMWISIKQSKMTRMHPLPPGLQLKDYHAPSRLALTYDPHSSKPILSLWKTQPGAQQAEAVLSWYGSGNSNKSSFGRGDESWARFASDRIVIFRDSGRNLIAWDFRDKKAVWTTLQETAQAPTPELSPGRRYLLVPESKSLRVIDPIAGRQLASFPLDGEIKSLSIADDGQNVLLLLDSTLVAIDLTGATQRRVIDVGFMDLPASTTVKWLDQDVVCLSTTNAEMLLFSLDRGIPLWRYEFDTTASYRNIGDDRVRRTVDSHLVYAASAEHRIEKGPKRGQIQRGIGVGAVKLPGEDASGYVKYLKRDELIVFDRGESIRIEVDAIQDEDAIRQALSDQVETNGWRLDETSSNVLAATLERGPSQTVQYRFGTGSFGPPSGFGPPSSFGPPGMSPPRITPPTPRFGPTGGIRPQFGPRGPSFGPSRSGPGFGPSRSGPSFGPPRSGPSFGASATQPSATIKSATVQPFLSTIELRIDGKPAWRARSSSGVPPMIQLRPGESLQQKINETQKPNIGFFSSTDVPESIINPAFRTGLGTSVITNRGLVKKKTE